NCGVCDFETTQNVFSAPEEIAAPAAAITGTGREKNYRLTFTKKGNSRFLSHLELSGSLLRALRRSSLKLSYSTGFHPHPKISFATATSVGMESDLEYLDITAVEYPSALPGLLNEINSALPGGVAVLEIKPLAADEPDLSRLLRAFAYELILPEKKDDDLWKPVAERISSFLARASFPIERLSKGKTIRKDIRPFVEKLAMSEDGKKIILIVQHAQGGSARPVDIITHVLGFNDDQARQIRIVKTATLLRR
ncbi:MAG TPA: TIGR03936 family radical SAM-associated protein, partial [Smithellaceae bacterium]|nr:TIGR03936 family radical SAM-associated protein [Smithellaceae bacterium]